MQKLLQLQAQKENILANKMIHLNEQSQLADLYPLRELRQMSNAYDQKILETRRRLSLKHP